VLGPVWRWLKAKAAMAGANCQPNYIAKLIAIAIVH
jgi:hypothetical protein